MERSFSKPEKLKSQKLIKEVFEQGASIKRFPVRLLYIEKTSLENHQAAFAVPKKNFKSAVHRNRLKRQLREAYRLQKDLLSKDHGKKFVMIFLFIGKEPLPYKKLHKTMGFLLKNLKS